jgi:hypothetical protein
MDNTAMTTAAAELRSIVAKNKKVISRVRFGALASLLGTACFTLVAQALYPFLVAPIVVGGAIAFSFCSVGWMVGSSVTSNLENELRCLVEKAGKVIGRSRSGVEQLPVTWEAIGKQDAQSERDTLELERKRNPMLASTGLRLVKSRPEDVEPLLREAEAEQEQMRFPSRAGARRRDYLPLPQV